MTDRCFVMLKPMRAGLSGYARIQTEAGGALAFISARGLCVRRAVAYWYCGGTARELCAARVNRRGEATFEARLPKGASAPERLQALFIVGMDSAGGMGGERATPLLIGLCARQSAGCLMDAKNALLGLCERLERERAGGKCADGLPTGEDVSESVSVEADISAPVPDNVPSAELPSVVAPAELPSDVELAPVPANVPSATVLSAVAVAPIPMPADVPPADVPSAVAVAPTAVPANTPPAYAPSAALSVSAPADTPPADVPPVSAPLPAPSLPYARAVRVKPRAVEPSREIFLTAIDPRPYIVADEPNAEPQAALVPPQSSPLISTEPTQSSASSTSSRLSPHPPPLIHQEATQSPTLSPRNPSSPPSRRTRPVDSLPALACPAEFASLNACFAARLPDNPLGMKGWRFVCLNSERTLYVGRQALDGKVARLAYAFRGECPPDGDKPYRRVRGMDGDTFYLLVQRA